MAQDPVTDACGQRLLARTRGAVALEICRDPSAETACREPTLSRARHKMGCVASLFSARTSSAQPARKPTSYISPSEPLADNPKLVLPVISAQQTTYHSQEERNINSFQSCRSLPFQYLVKGTNGQLQPRQCLGSEEAVYRVIRKIGEGDCLELNPHEQLIS